MEPLSGQSMAAFACQHKPGPGWEWGREQEGERSSTKRKEKGGREKEEREMEKRTGRNRRKRWSGRKSNSRTMWFPHLPAQATAPTDLAAWPHHYAPEPAGE